MAEEVRFRPYAPTIDCDFVNFSSFWAISGICPWKVSIKGLGLLRAIVSSPAFIFLRETRGFRLLRVSQSWSRHVQRPCFGWLHQKHISIEFTITGIAFPLISRSRLLAFVYYY